MGEILFMWKSFKLGMAFIGAIIGAGFASGQETLQYYTSFGMMGTVGAVLATVLYAYIGMSLVKVGSRMKALSHKEVFYRISGRTLGAIIDFVIIITLFGVGAVMIAGAGSNLNQQFGVPHSVGILLMIALVFISGLVNVDRFISIIGTITPFLIIMVVIVSAYSIFTMEHSIAYLNEVALQTETTLPNWFIASINHVFFNIAVGAAIGLVMGGAEPNEKIASRGGFIGGLGVGIVIIIGHLAIFSQVDVVQAFEMPLLELANMISPVLGFIMAIILFGMIFNTAASMFFSLGARLFEVGFVKFKVSIAVFLVASYFLSFIGFTDLISYLYPFIGYMGLILSGTLIYASIRMFKDKDYLVDQTKSKPDEIRADDLPEKKSV
jgi:uncharacterized membrane protein YkvI